MNRFMRLLATGVVALMVSVVAVPAGVHAAEVVLAVGGDCGLGDHWAAPYACELIEDGIITAEQVEAGIDLNASLSEQIYLEMLARAGASSLSVVPDGQLTRGEAIVLLAWAAAGEAPSGQDLRVLEGYADAARADQATREALAYLLLRGVVQGRDTGELDLDAPVTLGEAAKLINLAMPEVLPEGTDKISLLVYSDFHGRLEPSGAELGAARFTTAIAGQLLKNPNTVLIDGGDTFQGTPISNLVNGASVQEWRNKVGVRLSTLGNHEFDWNVPTLQGLLQTAEHPVVSANIFFEGTQNRPEWLAPTAVLEVGGYKIGFIGITTPETKGIVLAANIEGLDFVDPAPVINAEAKALREAGADLVVVVAHAAASQSADEPLRVTNEVADWMAQVTERVDAITGAHSHEMAAGYVLDAGGNKVPAVQSGQYGTGLARIDLYINRADKQVTKAAVDVWNPAQTLAPTPWANDLVAKWAAEIEPIKARPIGKLAQQISRTYEQSGESALGDFTTDAMLAGAQGAQIAITNGGGIRAHLTPNDEGWITWGDLYTTSPFGNTLVLVDMKGSEIKTLLEQGLNNYVRRLNKENFPRPLQVSGITYVWDYAKPDDERVVEIKLADGTPLDMDATYKVVVNNFMASGGDNLYILAELTDRQIDTGIVMLEALVEHFKALSADEPLTYELQNRVQVLNIPEDLRLPPE
ncbi:bifunctional metallophosphatase/5'-nucleotidase [Symbiobacterium terraclitae]|uniref:bifunctional metallophosphatase/5'-nucleotidase n=1 Tax=Symbiobacterium terraclitae TaxID=557451 RepID=UPI0035B512B5